MLRDPSLIGGVAHLAAEAVVVPLRLLLLPILLLALAGLAPSTVVVEYAGSLVTPMEGPVAVALRREGITFDGEARGSKAITHLIESGLRTPDVFISADASLVAQLRAEGRVASATTFAGGSLVLGYAATSSDAERFRAAARGRLTLRALLATPGLRIGRTDPALDPKGQRTIQALHILRITGPVPGAVFPEEDLLVRLESGSLDCAFLYSTEAIARHIPYIPLPGKAALSNEITYTLAIMKQAPDPQAAQRFATFIVHGKGRGILERAGLVYR